MQGQMLHCGGYCVVDGPTSTARGQRHVNVTDQLMISDEAQIESDTITDGNGGTLS